MLNADDPVDSAQPRVGYSSCTKNYLRSRSNKRSAASILTLITLSYCCIAVAGNGLNLISSGVESVTLGGADVAVSRNASAVSTNPAGLIQISGGRLDLDSSMAFALDVGHRDQLGNDLQFENNPLKYAEFGYAQHLKHHPLAFGVGLFVQGGAGAVYRDVITPFGGRDEFSSLFRIAKLSMGAAYQARPNFSVGVSLAVFYADMNQKIFPNTSFYNVSDPQQSFYGYELDGA
jgi:long-chain fatty acid transport protein